MVAQQRHITENMARKNLGTRNPANIRPAYPGRPAAASNFPSGSGITMDITCGVAASTAQTVKILALLREHTSLCMANRTKGVCTGSPWCLTFVMSDPVVCKAIGAASGCYYPRGLAFPVPTGSRRMSTDRQAAHSGRPILQSVIIYHHGKFDYRSSTKFWNLHSSEQR